MIRITFCRTTKKKTPEPLTYIKLPYYGEQHKRQVIRLSKRCGLQNVIRIIFESERPLSHRFRMKRELPTCPAQCVTCATAARKGLCYRKYCVYELQCKSCPKRYIGHTGRTIRSRLREHFRPASAFFQHTQEAHQLPPEASLTWKIIATERNTAKRRALEAIYIARFSDTLVNGCSGDTLLPFL